MSAITVVFGKVLVLSTNFSIIISVYCALSIIVYCILHNSNCSHEL